MYLLRKYEVQTQYYFLYHFTLLFLLLIIGSSTLDRLTVIAQEDLDILVNEE